jgi:hypothetical protein
MPYRLYVDEVGNDDMFNTSDERHRYLSLSGVAMDQDYARDHATPTLNALKADVFKHDPDEQIILHRKDIMNKRGYFHALRCRAIPHAVFAAFNPSRCSTSSRMMNFWILPVTVIGNSSTNST